MKNSVHDNGGFIGRVADYTATDYYTSTTVSSGVSSTLNYEWYNHNRGHPTTEAALDQFFDVSQGDVSLGGTGTWTTDINWSNNGTSSTTVSKPNYLPNDKFALKLYGNITAPETGTYTIKAIGDDALDVFIDGSRILYWYGGHGFTSVPASATATISLVAGQSYSFVSRMEEGSGGDGKKLQWQKPSDSALSVIPISAFNSSQIVTTNKNKKNTGVWSMDADYLNAGLAAIATFAAAKVHVDADDTNSYSGTGTTWSDLSGNNYDLTLSSAGVYNSTGVKHMAFQASSDMATRSLDIPISQTNGVTYVVATRPKLPTGTSWRTLTRGRNVDHHVIIESGSYDIGAYNNSAGAFRDSGADQNALPSHTNNDWILMYFRWANGEGYKFSYNDTPSTIRGTLASDTYGEYDSNGFKALGNWQGGGQPWGDIAFFAAWETELTDAELTTIYNAYKSRFSLP